MALEGFRIAATSNWPTHTVFVRAEYPAHPICVWLGKLLGRIGESLASPVVGKRPVQEDCAPFILHDVLYCSTRQLDTLRRQISEGLAS